MCALLVTAALAVMNQQHTCLHEIVYFSFARARATSRACSRLPAVSGPWSHGSRWCLGVGGPHGGARGRGGEGARKARGMRGAGAWQQARLIVLGHCASAVCSVGCYIVFSIGCSFVWYFRKLLSWFNIWCYLRIRRFFQVLQIEQLEHVYFIISNSTT